MRTYIVFDLEWNQSAHGKADSLEDFPFEIIEIGAVRLDERFRNVGEFHRLICPRVYRQLHYAISEVTHLRMDELRRHGIRFEQAAGEFRDWCGGGDDTVYCTWGNMDLTELQRNLRFFDIENWLPWPLLYYDVQKLYGLLYKDGARLSLDSAVKELELPEERPFHRALDDAGYTGKVLARMAEQEAWTETARYVSVDYYRLPVKRGEEIRLEFPGYSKYVSRVFADREAVMEDRTVTELRCRRCGKLLRKKIRWFTPNQKIYYALAICPVHGWVKGKIRMKHWAEDQNFAVKTVKQTDEEGAGKIRLRREELRKRRAERNRSKRIRESGGVADRTAKAEKR